MIRASVIGHGVEENFYSVTVSVGDQFLIILQAAKMRIDGVQIDGAIAVIILRGAIFQIWA